MDLPHQLLQQGIKRGSILLSDSFEDKIAGFFFINSRIHPIVQAKTEQFAMQYQLRKRDYDFLRYDSFLSANDLLTRSTAYLAKTIQDGQTSIVGQLTDEDLTAVLEACR